MLLILLATSLLAACGDETTVPVTTEQPRAAPPTATSGTPATPTSTSNTVATTASQTEISAAIVVPLDPDGTPDRPLRPVYRQH